MKGTIVLIPFPFTDFTATKLRPALILYENNYDVVIAFISSKIPATISQCDVPIFQQHKGFVESGLKVDSVIKLDKIATVMKKYIVGELGELDSEFRASVNAKTREIYQL
jgi:mRNA interferase MazF